MVENRIARIGMDTMPPMKRGASTRLRNKDRATAADVARARAFPAISELLKEA